MTDLSALQGADLELDALNVGHLPLVRAVVRQLGIDEAIDEMLPIDPRSRVSDADCVVALLLNILSGRCALYAMPERFEGIDTSVLFGSDVPVDAFNDARLAAALDHLFDIGVDNVLGRIVQRFLARSRSPETYSAFIDTTSISLHGAYDIIPAEDAPTPTRGFSKDHRPDLKQLIFGLSLHGAAGIPLTSAMLDGNTADSHANRLSIEKLAGLLPEEDDVTVVGDSKLVDAETLGHLLHEGFHFVSLVPLSFNVRKDLVEEVRQAGEELPELGRVPGKRKADPDLLYRGRAFRRAMKVVHPQTNEAREETFTLVVVRSDAKATGFENKLDKLLVKEEKALRAAVKKANKRRLRCREDAEIARDAALATLALCRCDLRIVEKTVADKRSGPGRPRKDEEAPSHIEFVLEYEELERDDEAVEREAFHASHYVLVCSREEWSAEQVLAEYQEQSMIEGVCGFRWLKDVVSVAPVMLKTPHRITALGLIFVLALMVRNYIQFTLRQGLKESGETVRGRKRRKRVQNPTTETAFLNFMHAKTHYIRLGGTLIKRTSDKLSEDALTVLRLLGVPPPVFALPFEKWPSVAEATSGT